MTPPPAVFPDPALTANVYCERRQDHFLSTALATFWRQVRCLEGELDSYLWFVRYGRCGEHVKVRLHVPEERRESLAALLTTTVETYFAEHEPPEPAQRKDWSYLPPIDEQDQAEEDYPDRTLLWTRYQRSHVSLGGKPFLDDDRYSALMTRCLGCGLRERPGIDRARRHRPPPSYTSPVHPAQAPPLRPAGALPGSGRAAGVPSLPQGLAGPLLAFSA